MVPFLKRIAEPVTRFTVMQDVDHEATFDAFAAALGRAVVESRVRDEPRVVSFRLRAMR